MATQPNLWTLFHAAGQQFLAQHPTIQHEWILQEGGAGGTLSIPQQCPDGYPIEVQVDDESVLLTCGNFHDHHTPPEGNHEFVKRSMYLLRELLSPSMRVHEFHSNGRPYKFRLESKTSEGWETELTMGFVFYNYFGRKTEVFLQNTLLEVSSDSSGQPS